MRILFALTTVVIMLSYDEFQNLYRLGEYSTKTSASQYSGLDLDWVLAQSQLLATAARQPLNRPTNSSIASDLGNEVLLGDNAPPHLNPAKNNKQPPSQRISPDNSDVGDPSLPADGIRVSYREDEEFSDEEAVAKADCNFALSSPLRQNLDSDVNFLSHSVEISDNFYFQDVLIRDEPPKAPAARGKKRWQMTDLPCGMNDKEAWRKVLIPTVYWYLGNKRDVWIYDDDELASDLGRIISAVYPSSLRQEVTVEGPIFRIVSIISFSI